MLLVAVGLAAFDAGMMPTWMSRLTAELACSHSVCVEGAGAVHRSPAASEDRPRLVLTLNKARQQCCDGCVSQ